MDLSPIASLSAWQALEQDARSDFLTRLAAHLGDGWTSGSTALGREAAGELVSPQGVRFVVVPGGTLRMGFSVDDLFALQSARSDPSERSPWAHELSWARPVRRIALPPFLIARFPIFDDPELQGMLDEEGEGGAFDIVQDGMLGPGEAAQIVPEGMRLPSEAELEWVLRECGRTRFTALSTEPPLNANNCWTRFDELEQGLGLLGVCNVWNWAADGWHDSYVDAPQTHTAWKPVDELITGRSAHTFFQDTDNELIALHPAYRRGPNEMGLVRPVVDIPGAIPTDDPSVAWAEHADTLDALKSNDETEQGAALRALELLAFSDPADCEATIEAVIGALPELQCKAEVLATLAEIAVGGHFNATVEPCEHRRIDSLSDSRQRALRAVAKGIDTYASFLHDAALRDHAALALTFCGADAQAALSALDGEGPAIDIARVRLGGVLPTGDDDASRAVAALGQAWQGEADLDALEQASTIEPINIPFSFGQLANVATGLMIKSGEAGRSRAALAMARQVVAAEGRGMEGIAATALQLSFTPAPSESASGAVRDDGQVRRAGNAPDVPLLFDELTDAQREVLLLIGAMPLKVDWAAFRLPRELSDRLCWMGKKPSGVVDRHVTFEGESRPLWWVLRTLQRRACIDSIPLEAHVAALNAQLVFLDPLERVLAELERARYDLWTAWWAADRSGHRAGWPSEPGLHGVVAAAKEHDANGLRTLLEAQADRRLASPSPRAMDLLSAFATCVETLPQRFDALLLKEQVTAIPADVLTALGMPRAESVLLQLLQPSVEHCLGAGRFQIRMSRIVEQVSQQLASVPSARVACALLILGCSWGQPTRTRELVLEHGGDAVHDLLAKFDQLPPITDWPTTQKAMQALDSLSKSL